MMRPRGKPPTPSARSSDSAPVGTGWTRTAAASPPSFMIEPAPNCRSICVKAPCRAESRALAAFSCSLSMSGLSFEVRTSEAKDGTGQMFAPLQGGQVGSALLPGGREIALRSRHNDRLRLHEVPHRNLPLLGAHERSVAAVVGQPLSSSDGRRGKAPDGPELPGPLAPELTHRAMGTEFLPLRRHLQVRVLRCLRTALEAAAVEEDVREPVQLRPLVDLEDPRVELGRVDTAVAVVDLDAYAALACIEHGSIRQVRLLQEPPELRAFAL